MKTVGKLRIQTSNNVDEGGDCSSEGASSWVFETAIGVDYLDQLTSRFHIAAMEDIL
jgi:hypothetical protein